METGLFADALELQTQLRKSLANLNEFDHEYRDELSRRGADRQSLGRRLFLQSQFIADARIPGISARHIRLLAARGVETAFDVEDWRLQSVDGLAERTRKSLLDWKQDLNVRAPAEDPSNLCDDERRAVSQEFRRREMEAIRRTESDIERLETVIDALCSQVRDFRVRQRSLEAERAAAATDYSIFRR